MGMQQALLMGGLSSKNFEMLFEGANGSTTFTETFGKTITPTGSVVISTAQFADGTSSGFFPGGTADYLSTPSSTDFDYGSGTFAIKVKIRPATVTGTHMICTTRSAAGSDLGYLLWQIDAGVRFICWGPTAGVQIVDMLSVSGLTLNTWASIEVRRVGTAFTLLINGSSAATGTSSAAIIASTNALQIGRDPSTNTRGFNGYMDTLQFFKGGLT